MSDHDCPACGRPLGARASRFPVFDFRRRYVWTEHRAISLTPNEAMVLEYLYENSPNACTVHAIGWNVWRDLEVDSRNLLRQTVHRLRRKFAGDREAGIPDTGIEIHTAKGKDFSYLDDESTGYWLTW